MKRSFYANQFSICLGLKLFLPRQNFQPGHLEWKAVQLKWKAKHQMGENVCVCVCVCVLHTANELAGAKKQLKY